MLYENKDMRIEGRLVGFDEYMNIVLDDAFEVMSAAKGGDRRPIGRILLKGDNIVMISQINNPQ